MSKNDLAFLQLVRILLNVLKCLFDEQFAAKDVAVQAEKAYCDIFNSACVGGADISGLYTGDCAYMAPGSPVVCGKASKYVLTFLFQIRKAKAKDATQKFNGTLKISNL